ncbi:MAG: histidine kinase [Flavobacteriales bacterium]|nr:histidine kinase [Flavobacteriales bacterium]
MKRIPLLILTLLLLLSGIDLFAQVPKNKILEVVTKNSKSRIQRIAQDQNGFLWLGIEHGVILYDGILAQPVVLSDTITTSKNTTLLVDHNTVYAGFEDGTIVSINTNTSTVREVWKFVNTKISSIQVTEDGSLWAATEGEGLLKLQDGKFRIYTTDDGLADNYIHELINTNNQLAIATDLGLSVCQLQNENILFKNYSTDHGLTDNLILTMSKTADGLLLMGMQNGTICSFDLQSETASAFEYFNNRALSPVSKILLPENEIIVVTENDGVFMFNKDDLEQVQQFFLEPENAAIRKPLDCVIANDGNMLITFGDNKILLSDFRIQFIRMHDGVSFSDAQCVLADSDGYLWFANSDGIYRHAGEFASSQMLEKKYKAPPHLDKIVTMCEGHDNSIYFGTFGSGLGKLDKKTGKVKFYTEKNGLVNDNVLSLTLRDSTIWMATLGGVATLEFKKKKPIFSHFDGESTLGINFIYTVYNDKHNRIWLGTDGRGLVKVENGNFQFLLEKFPEAGKSIISITEDEHGNIWFTSTDKGLQWTNEKSLHDIMLGTDHVAPEVFAIHSDPLGNIVALTSIGLASINHHTEVATFMNTEFDISANYLNVIDMDSRGRMWLGTESALIRFNEYYEGKTQRPITWIKGVDVMLVPIDTSTHIFSYDQNHFTFHLTSIWLEAPENVSFQYKLEGNDLGWQQTLDRAITFSKLEPGTYLMRVRSSINSDWQFADEKSFAFIIKKPYWYEWWFVAMVLTLLALIIWSFVQLRFRRIRERETLAREKVQSQFDTLRNQVNPHFLFNSFNTLISIISTDSQAAVGYVEKLSDYFRIVLQQRDKDVITLREELELVKNYLYLQKQRFGDNLDIIIHVEDRALVSILPPLTIQLLVENAIKHNIISRSKPLTIHISTIGQYIRISNNVQEKLSKEPSTGIGLPNIRHRYRILFSKEIEVISAGGEFVILLPIMKQE